MAKQNSKPTSPLAAIVTGMEHSCTTHLCRMILLHPRLNAGFECGLLLASKPAKFCKVDPFYGWMSDSTSKHRWNITCEGMADITAADNWDEAYRRIIQHSPLFRNGADLLVDKTPAYIRQLGGVLRKVPGIPCIVATKDILLQYYSYKKRNRSLRSFRRAYGQARRSLRLAMRRYPDEILIVRQKDLIEDPRQLLLRIYDFMGLAMPSTQEFEDCICEQNRRGTSRLSGRAHYQYDEVVRAAESEITADERRVLESLPDFVD